MMRNARQVASLSRQKWEVAISSMGGGLIGERWKMDIYRIGAGNALSLAIPLQSIYIVRKINTGPIKFFFFIRRFGRGLAVPDENG